MKRVSTLSRRLGLVLVTAAVAAAGGLVALIPANAVARTDAVRVGPVVANLSAGSNARRNVFCPINKVAVTGGAAVTGEGPGDFRTVLQEQGPFSAATSGWQVGVRNNDTVRHTVTAYAVCINVPTGFQYVVQSFAVTPGQLAIDARKCPGSKVVVGGGVRLGTGTNSSAFQETIPGTTQGPGGSTIYQWTNIFRNDNTTTRTYLFSAVCVDPLAGYEFVRRDTTVAAGGYLRNTVTCPTGKVTLGGGAFVAREGLGDFRVTIQESAPGTANGRSLWMAAVRNNDTVQHNVRIQAVCVNTPPGHEIVQATV